MTRTFCTTQWTQVLAASGEGPEAEQALSDLCAAYYDPVVAFLRRSIGDEDRARDLAHEFFARVLERHGLHGAHPQRGRFRTYLLGAVKHFLANQHASTLRAKRGAGAIHEPLAAPGDTSGGCEIADPAALLSDTTFDREWALNVLNRALGILAQDARQSGAPRLFELLRPWLTGDRPDMTQADAARKLGMTEGAVRVAVHRLRRRFREAVKAEIGRTVGDPGEADAELRHLIAVLS